MIASIVIPTCERNEELALCLDRLKAEVQAVSQDRFEVIVTDDGCNGTARGLIGERFPWARWVQGPRRGPAANRNSGAATAAGDWILFIDDDCLPEATLLSAYFEAMERGSVHVLEGRTSALGKREHLDMECPENETGGYLWSCNMAVRRDLFVKMGGFDPHFPGPAMEDVDFRTRLLKAGESIEFVPAATVFHPWRRRRGMAFALMHARSRSYYVAKHPELLSAVSWRELGKQAVRRIFVQLPRDIWTFGIRGLGAILMADLITPFAVRRALRQTREKSPR